MAPDYYNLLGVSPSAGDDDLRGAVELLRQRLGHFAPGVEFSDEDVARVFPEKWSAYRVLADPASRQAYDVQLRASFEIVNDATDGAAPIPQTRWSAFLSYAAFFGLMTIGVLFLLLLAGYLL